MIYFYLITLGLSNKNPDLYNSNNINDQGSVNLSLWHFLYFTYNHHYYLCFITPRMINTTTSVSARSQIPVSVVLINTYRTQPVYADRFWVVSSQQWNEEKSHSAADSYNCVDLWRRHLDHST